MQGRPPEGIPGRAESGRGRRGLRVSEELMRAASRASDTDPTVTHKAPITRSGDFETESVSAPGDTS